MPSHTTTALSIAATAILMGCSSSRDPVPQAAPGSVQAQACGRRAIQLSWNQPASNLNAVIVERSRDGGPFELVTSAAATATSYVDYGLEAGVSYSYRLANINPQGASTYSSIASATATSPDLVALSVVNSAGETQLAVAAADAPGTLQIITPPLLSAQGNLEVLAVDPELHDNDGWIVYTASPAGQPTQTQLFAVPTCGGSPPRELTPPGNLTDFKVYDDRYAVARVLTQDTAQLISADLRGGSTLLFDGQYQGLSPQTFFPQWDPKARRSDGSLYYAGDGVWAVPVDGSTPPRSIATQGPGTLTFETRSDGRHLIVSDAIATKFPFGSGAIWDLVLFGDGGSTRLFSYSSFGVPQRPPNSYGVVADRVVWRYDLTTGPPGTVFTNYTALASGDLNGRIGLTPWDDAFVYWEGLRHGAELVITAEAPVTGAPAAGIYSVPVTGATAPIQLAAGPLADLVSITNVGNTIVYGRASTPGTVYTCRIGNPLSEAAIATATTAEVHATMFAAEGGQERAADAVIVRIGTAIGPVTYTDFLSITEDSAGVMTVSRLSNQGSSQVVPDGATAPEIIGTLTKEGRVLYQRGSALYSAELGVADSERPLSTPGVPLDQIQFDTTNTDGTAYFVAQGQVWSTPIDGSSSPAQLSSLPALATSPQIMSIGPNGTVAFASESAGTTTTWIAQAGLAGSATAIPANGSPTIRAAF